MTATFLLGDVRERMAELPDGHFDFILCSPPFLALRSYLPPDHPDKDKEIGSEATPAEFIDVLLELTAEWGRLLAPHGSIAIELGDTYSGSGGAGGDWSDSPATTKARVNGGSDGGPPRRVIDDLAWPLAKSLVCVPQLYQVALAYGINPVTGQPSPAGRWRVRNLKPWIRSNPPVGALGDKERPATSYVIVACRASDRWFDLDAVRTTPSQPPATYTGNGYTKGRPEGVAGNEAMPGNAAGAPPRDWWHHVDAILDTELAARAGKTNSPRDALRAIYDKGINADNEDVRLWTREWGEHFRDLFDEPSFHPVDAVLDTELAARAGKTNGGMPTGQVVRRGPRQRDTGQTDPGSLTVGAQGVHLRRALERAGILQTQDALDVSPRGYTGAHYAVWPPELVRLLVDEMCPRRVCTTCGQPSRRLTEATYEPHGDPAQQNAEHKAQADYLGQQRQQNAQGMTHGRATKHTTTLGWSDCGHNTWRPGRILDPFVGSGTTLAVATGMGRDATGIDIDERNALLAAERVGMFLTVDIPDREVPA
jgi:hypothetical protein